MAIELEKRELRSYEIRKRKYKQRITILTIIAILIIICAAAYLINRIVNKNYTSYEVIHTTERNDSVFAQYDSYGLGILRYSRDGVMAMDGAGNLLWNGSYEMNDPIVDINGEYVVVGDRGSNVFKVYNDKGEVSSQEVLHPIIKVEVAKQGVVAVLMGGDKVYYLEFYTEDGTKVVENMTVNQEDGYPVDIALSEDGRKLATSYVKISNGDIQSVLTFYNFGGVGQNYVDRIAAGYDYGKTIVPKLEFINNDTVCAIGDDKFSIYSMKEKPKAIYEETLTKEIHSVFYNNKYLGLVLNNAEGSDAFQLLLYNEKGKKVLDRTMNYAFDHIEISGDDIIMYSDMEWTIIKVSGSEKFHYNFEKNISFIAPVNNRDKYLVVDDTNMLEVRLIEQKDEKK